MKMRIVNLETGMPDLDTARRRLIAEIAAARRDRFRLMKLIHGWGSSGKGGTLCTGIRKSLGRRIREGRVACFVTGERFSSDTNEGRELAQRQPSLRKDPDFNRANPGITIVELTP